MKIQVTAILWNVSQCLFGAFCRTQFCSLNPVLIEQFRSRSYIETLVICVPPHISRVNLASRHAQLSGDRPIWRSDRPIWRSDKPIWRSDKPDRRSDKPIWRSDRPNRRSDRPNRRIAKINLPCLNLVPLGGRRARKSASRTYFATIKLLYQDF